jgi:acetyl-CoA carboxylase biotin carboxylase subunit
MFDKVLIANRGEIAVRIARGCRDLGLRTVAVYSEADREARHVSAADEAVAIGPAPSRESYLRIDRILEAARATGAQAVHPGYGFLAENAAFARACEDAGLVFVGPRSETIAAMGEKTSARRLAVEAGVPVVPGALAPLDHPATLRAEAERLGYPVMLKAAAGGGGKGLRLVAGPDELVPALERAKSEAQSAFGDPSVYVEKALLRPRHIEIQVAADHHGSVVHLFERECSIQRRHQKVIEESPAPSVSGELRARMGALAVALCRRVGYRNVGTLEFLVDAEGAPYFLEMNTRLQVEHPVTELVTGIDLVALQLRIAQGRPLPFGQEDLAQRGHAIECRVYAEDPDRGFLPSPGRIEGLRAPAGPGVRDDSGVYEGFVVPSHYDPLLSKLVAHGADRGEAIARLRRAVDEYRVVGVRTTLPLFARVLRDEAFARGEFDTGYLDRLLATPAPDDAGRDVAAALAAVAAFRERRAARLSTEEAAAPAGGWRRAGWREAVR